MGKKIRFTFAPSAPHSDTTITLVSIQLAQYKQGPLRNFNVSANKVSTHLTEFLHTDSAWENSYVLFFATWNGSGFTFLPPPPLVALF